MAGDLQQYNIIGQPIGSGAYGYVYKGQCRLTGQTYALKKTKIEKFEDGIPSTTMREISILTELQHRNIVGLKDVVMTDTFIYFVQEFCNMDLRNFLQSIPDNKCLSPP